MLRAVVSLQLSTYIVGGFFICLCSCHFVDTFRGLPFDYHQLQHASYSLILCGVFPLMINDSILRKDIIKQDVMTVVAPACSMSCIICLRSGQSVRPYFFLCWWAGYFELLDVGVFAFSCFCWLSDIAVVCVPLR